NKYHANIHMGKIEEELALTHVDESAVNKLPEYYYKSGVPEVKGREMSENTREFTSVVTPYPKVTNYITEQKEYKIGNEIYKPYVITLHYDELIIVYNKKNKVLISNDHILLRITSNISDWYQGVSNPLQSCFNSLKLMKELT